MAPLVGLCEPRSRGDERKTGHDECHSECDVLLGGEHEGGEPTRGHGQGEADHRGQAHVTGDAYGHQTGHHRQQQSRQQHQSGTHRRDAEHGLQILGEEEQRPHQGEHHHQVGDHGDAEHTIAEQAHVDEWVVECALTVHEQEPDGQADHQGGGR